MAKRPKRRKRISLGSSASEHANRLEDAVKEMESFAEQGEKFLHNGLCRQAVDALLSATRANGNAHAHRVGAREVRELDRRRINAATRVSRLRLSALDRCTRDD